MLDDEVQLREVGRGLVDIRHVEGVAVQRQDRRTLVDMDVLDAELLRFLEVPLSPVVAELVALARPVPFGGIELDALELILGRQFAQRFKPHFAVARVPGAVEDETVGVFFLQHGVLFGRVEAVDVEVLQVSRLEDRHVVVTFDEQVVVHRLGAVLVELFLRPDIFFRAERRMVAVEAVDELLAVDVLQVLLAAVPQVGVTVDDEDFFAVRRPVHAFLRRFVFY